MDSGPVPDMVGGWVGVGGYVLAEDGDDVCKYLEK